MPRSKATLLLSWAHLLTAHKLRPPARKGVRACKGQLKRAPHQEAAEDAPAHIPHLHSVTPWLDIPCQIMMLSLTFSNHLEVSASDWMHDGVSMSALWVVTHQSRHRDSIVGMTARQHMQLACDPASAWP